ncbi:molecular chaperone [Thioalkalivibrio sp. ALM2T]|uniref:TorD/DmsD family molecular chaperone n=1 Tax=Thioalkalivibrio sp. ALM2T TaxID=1158184 RepID=UPI0009DAF308|nr:molecular chaperone TorD family protein [Thioalkalivibrio sp. ALM2T]
MPTPETLRPMNHVSAQAFASEPQEQARQLALRAERCLCFARCLLTPQDAAQREAIRDYLLQDLQGMTHELGEEMPAAAEQLATAIPNAFGDLGTALRSYADLFLTPPVPAHLNTGWYQDGSLMGRHVDILRAWYNRHGMEVSEHFRDLPDHASMQIEFLAVLYAEAAEALESGNIDAARQSMADAHGFIGAFPANWIAPLRRDIARCVEGPNAPEQFYLALIDWLDHALTADRAWLTRLGVFQPAPETEAESTRTGKAHPVAAANTAPVGSDEAHAFMVEQLRAAGLDASHLGTPAPERDAAMGLHPMRPVEPRGKGR